MEEDECFEFDEKLLIAEDCDNFQVELENVTNYEEEIDDPEPGPSNAPPGPSKKRKTTKKGEKNQSKEKKSEGKQPTKPRLPCTKEGCLKTLANPSTLKAHLRRHEIAGLLTKFPQGAEISEKEIQDLICSALTELIKSSKSGELSRAAKEYANQLLTAAADFNETLFPAYVLHHFQDVLSASKAALSSGLACAFLRGCNVLINNSNFVFGLKAELKKISECQSESVVNVFIGKFFHELSKKFLVYILKQLHNLPDYVPSSRSLSKDVIESNDFRQVIFYIGGSVLHKFLKLQRRYPNNVRLRALSKIFREKFQEEARGDVDDQTLSFEDIEDSGDKREDDHWTRGRDRGGLIYITADAHNFFTALASFVLDCETESGTLQLEDVYDGVLNNPNLLSLWDKILKDKIEESFSLDALQCVCETMTKCARNGILRRRLQASLRKVFSSVSLRYSLAKH